MADMLGREARTSFCRLCEAFCGTIVTVEDGRPVRVAPDRDNPHTQGHICVKGPAIADIANDPDRVLRPLKRVGGPGEFAPVSWDEALDDIAARLGRVIAEHGPAAVATYFGNPGAFSTDTFMSSQWFLQRSAVASSTRPDRRTAPRAISRAGCSTASPSATRFRTCRTAIS